MAIKAYCGALSGLCFLAIGKWVLWWGYLCLIDASNPSRPWLPFVYRPWGASQPTDYFFLAAWPGVPLGAVTVIAFHLWRRGEQRRAALLCQTTGFIATAVLGINTGLALYSVYSVVRGMVATGGSFVVAQMQPYWLFTIFDRLVSNGALHWSILLWIAGYVLQRRIEPKGPAIN
jgi:hypothetical protein